MEYYEDFSNVMEQLYYTNSNEKILLNELLRNILQNSTFNHGLDIGAGQGLITQPLAERCKHLTLIEPLIDHASMLKNKFANAQIFQGLFQDFDSDTQFDIILCAHMLYYLQPEELTPVLTRMVNLLMPHGSLFIVHGETHFLFDIFSKKLAHKFKVFLPKTEEIVAILAPFGDCEVICSKYEKTFYSEQESLLYLADFLTVTEHDIASCSEEVEEFKRLLKDENDRKILTHTNSVIHFKKGE